MYGTAYVPFRTRKDGTITDTPALASTVQELPLRGSWQGAALTDEAAGQPETFQKQ